MPVSLHGDMDQRARTASLDAFKSGGVELIVCSDVAARGLDIPDVSHVFNFDVPSHAEDYVHRIGRTGRAGKTGVALSIVTPADQKYVAEIERLIARKIDWLEGESLANVPGEEPRQEARQEARRGERPQRSRRAGSGGGEARGRQSSSRPSDARRPPLPSQITRPAGETPIFPQPAKRNENAPPRAPYHEKDDGPPVLGMGDHIPMFLLRPATVKPLKAPMAKTEPGKTTRTG